jgi:hypothetical protein
MEAKEANSGTRANPEATRARAIRDTGDFECHASARPHAATCPRERCRRAIDELLGSEATTAEERLADVYRNF